MIKKNKFFLSLGIVTIIGLFVYFNKSTNEKRDHPFSIASNSKNNLQHISKTNSSDSTAVNTLMQTNDIEVYEWFQKEAANLDQPVVDQKQKEIEIKNKLNQFDTLQKLKIQKMIYDSNAPMNERIFANYLVLLSASLQNTEVVAELVLNPMPNYENVKPHSLEEVQRAQEYALRYMQIDKLFDLALASTDTSEKLVIQDKLRYIVDRSEDLKIKAYAAQKLKEIL